MSTSSNGEFRASSMASRHDRHLASGFTQSNHRDSGALHDRLYIVEVEIYSPGLVMSSVMPFIALTSTSSATLKAALIEILGRVPEVYRLGSR